MKAKKPNAELVCKQFEDALAPRLRLYTTDRAVYYHLLRHSRLEGKSRLHFSIIWLARNLGLTVDTVRHALRRLVQHRALRLIERSKAGHVMDVRLPEEVPGARRSRAQTHATVPSSDSANLEETDFMRTPELRQAIHAREGGVCFYCLRHTGPEMQCLDHVIPRAQLGPNSYRNLVSCCRECNSRKGERPAADFLRSLYREGRLTGAELIGALQSLNDLAAGNLRPILRSP
ncbi:MAG TPA: HNH endonuclease [Candidatus Acidoferrum sp.]|nr:HNH endonuclease [Candidatus Acidoferrum sp.]